MIPTPDLSHLSKTDFEHVYEPAEDTFILLDALEEDADALRALNVPVCLEVGSGSGCVSAFLGSILGSNSAVYFTTDINPRATSCTHRTGLQNRVPLDATVANFAAPFARRLHRKIDVLIFNPPYVPTSTEEAVSAQDTRDIAGAWAGGADGMVVTNRLLAQLDDLLSTVGRFYLVAMKQNNIPEITRKLAQQSMDCKTLLQRRAGGEHLHVLRITRMAIF